MALKTLKNASVAVGVTVIKVVLTGSPLRAIARLIGPAAPSAGRAMLPPKVTL